MRHKESTLKRWFSPRRVLVSVAAAVFIFGVAGVPTSGVSPAFAGKKKHKKHSKMRQIIHRSGAFLGVNMQELTDESRKGLDIKVKNGVLITVIEDSPADKAGIEDGDVIVKFGRKKVTSPEQLIELVQDADVGDEVKIELYRDDESMKVEVTLGDWADRSTLSFVVPDDFEFVPSFVSSLRPFRLGVRVSELDEDLAPYFGVEEGEGLLVLGVSDESAAEGAGVKAGDVIVEIEGSEIRSVGDIHEAMSEMDAGDEFEITVVRKKKNVKLDGKMTEHSRAFFGDRVFSRNGRAPHVQMFRGNDDLRKEMKELREELEQLKKEVKKSKSS